MKRENYLNILKGLDLIREAVISEMETEVVSVETVKNKIEEVKNDVETTPEVEEEAVEVETNTEAEDLNSKTLKELKDLAKELGVSTKGSKSTIIGRILEAQDNVEEVVEETKENILTEEEVEEFEEATETGEENPLEAQLNEMSVEELADILAEVGISTKGKKQSLIAKVLKAVEEGKIELADEEDADEEEEVVEETVEEVEEPVNDTIEETEDDEEGIELEEILDSLGTKELKDLAKELGIKVVLKDKKASLIEKITNFEDDDKLMEVLIEKGIIEATDEEEVEEDVDTEEEFVVEGSDVRIEAVENKFADLMEHIENGEIEMSEVKEFLEEYYADNKSELKKIEAMTEEDLANKYCWIQANLIDDEGQEVDFEEPYMVGDKPYCCGIPMKKLNETTYVCEIDGEEVELED